MTSLYDLLGVDSRASTDEIKAAYYRSMKEIHPDAGGSEDQAKRVNAAYDVLSDPERRSEYDRFADGAPCPICGRLFKDSDLAAQHTIAHEMKRTAPTRPPRVGIWQIILGVALAGFGLITSAAAVSGDEGGVIWYGAIIAGVLLMFRGVSLYVASGRVRVAYDEIMAEVDRLLRSGRAPARPSGNGSRRTSKAPSSTTESSAASNIPTEAGLSAYSRRGGPSVGRTAAPAQSDGGAPEHATLRSRRGVLIGAGVAVGAVAAILVMSVADTSNRGEAGAPASATSAEAVAPPLVAVETTSTTMALVTTTTTTMAPTTTSSAAIAAPAMSEYRDVVEWIGMTYGSEYVDDWPYFVVGGQLTNLASFASPHYFGENDAWNMAYFVDEDYSGDAEGRAYAILGSPDGSIAGALEYEYADNEYIGPPPLCWDDAFGPVVFTHDPDTLKVIHAWYPMDTNEGVRFAHHPVPSALDPDIFGSVSGGTAIPPCNG